MTIMQLKQTSSPQLLRHRYALNDANRVINIFLVNLLTISWRPIILSHRGGLHMRSLISIDFPAQKWNLKVLERHSYVATEKARSE